jgi:hypothetical protein
VGGNSFDFSADRATCVINTTPFESPLQGFRPLTCQARSAQRNIFERDMCYSWHGSGLLWVDELKLLAKEVTDLVCRVRNAQTHWSSQALMILITLSISYIYWPHDIVRKAKLDNTGIRFNNSLMTFIWCMYYVSSWPSRGKAVHVYNNNAELCLSNITRQCSMYICWCWDSPNHASSPPPPAAHCGPKALSIAL